ncbi:uncharacterized protein LOC143368062 [Andrena cerasifolii]|uniref:uncharacterized protein LOC143368062 n=1 Tax=Andrena cerasifolii TaxID=2819439 RepID=UPI004037A911
MEIAAAEAMWKRSMEHCNMRYTTMLSDGDAKTHTHIQSLQVYGPDIDIQKEECVNHIAKHMGSGLRNVVKEWRAKKVTLGGKGEGTLKESTIDKLTTYYRNAIVKNMPNVKAMEEAVMATLDHCSSTDSKLNHARCPKGKQSWCFYNRAKSTRRKPMSHTPMSLKLSEDVATKVKPLYERLSNENLMARCCKGGTQNANESLHEKVWRFCPKTTFVSKARLEVAVARAVSEFNMGCVASLTVRKQTAGEVVSETAISIARDRDKRRETCNAQQQSTTRKRLKKKQNTKKIAAERKRRKIDEDVYQPGGF